MTRTRRLLIIGTTNGSFQGKAIELLETYLDRVSESSKSLFTDSMVVLGDHEIQTVLNFQTLLRLRKHVDLNLFNNQGGTDTETLLDGIARSGLFDQYTDVIIFSELKMVARDPISESTVAWYAERKTFNVHYHDDFNIYLRPEFFTEEDYERLTRAFNKTVDKEQFLFLLELMNTQAY